MEKIMKKIIGMVLGLVLVLGWWTLKDKLFGTSSKDHDSGEGIPAKVWEGGGGTIAVEADSTSPAKFSFMIHKPRQSDGSQPLSEHWVHVPAGHHSFSFEVPPGAGGMVEWEADNPPAGTKLTWSLKFNGRELASESETLNEPLKANEAFFLQREYDDFATAEPDRQPSE